MERTRTLTQLALGVALIAVCTFLTIPGPVPFTMQTFAIFTVLGLLGGKRGTLAITCYLLMGTLGLPIFSGFRGGPAVLLGNTGGYLFGFLAVGLLYWLITHCFGKKFWVMATAMVVSCLVLYSLGTAWFLRSE